MHSERLLAVHGSINLRELGGIRHKMAGLFGGISY